MDVETTTPTCRKHFDDIEAAEAEAAARAAPAVDIPPPPEVPGAGPAALLGGAAVKVDSNITVQSRC